MAIIIGEIHFWLVGENDKGKQQGRFVPVGKSKVKQGKSKIFENTLEQSDQP